MAPPVVMQEYETRQLVFGAYDHLSYGNKIEAGEVQIDLSPRSWYWDHSSSKVVRDRWVYVFTSYQFRLNGSSTLLPQLRLLFEIYVDEEGKHWRTRAYYLYEPASTRTAAVLHWQGSSGYVWDDNRPIGPW